MDPTYRPAHEALADYYDRTGAADLARVHRDQLRARAPDARPVPAVR